MHISFHLLQTYTRFFSEWTIYKFTQVGHAKTCDILWCFYKEDVLLRAKVQNTPSFLRITIINNYHFLYTVESINIYAGNNQIFRKEDLRMGIISMSATRLNIIHQGNLDAVLLYPVEEIRMISILNSPHSMGCSLLKLVYFLIKNFFAFT